jgi:hypothetical protein
LSRIAHLRGIAPETDISQCAETMEPLLIGVECHAGYKADETPRRFRFERNWIEVEEVVDRWQQVERLPEWPRADYFKLQASDGRLYLLKHDLDANQWFLVGR